MMEYLPVLPLLLVYLVTSCSQSPEKQARAVIDRPQADMVTLTLAYELDAIYKK